MIKDRIALAEHFASLGFTNGAEIGVADGRYSEILCQKIPNLELLGVDVWAKYEKNWRSDEYQDVAYQKAKERLSKYNVHLRRESSLNASIATKDDYLDFVFIDGSHVFDHVMTDIIIWARKVKKGGIVSGHDYYQFHDSGIIQAVNAYVEEHKLDLNLTLAGVAEHKDDQCPCWWFIKK